MDYPDCPRCRRPDTYWAVRDISKNEIAFFNPASFLKISGGREDKVNFIGAMPTWPITRDFYNEIYLITCAKCQNAIYRDDYEFSRYWSVAKKYLIEKRYMLE